jgi:M6 family metalloprotease-like protein
MKALFHGWRHGSGRWGFLLLLALGLTHAAAAPSLEDCGYNNRKINGHEARGGRPLLVILATFDTAPPLANDPAYYDNLVFNLFSTNSMNGYFLENSNGRFYWTRAGSGMVLLTNLPAAQRWSSLGSDDLWHSNLVAQTMIRGLFDFSPYAADGITVREGDLGIVIINNDHPVGKDGAGANRQVVRVKQGASTVAVEMREPGGATSFADNTTFNCAAHEMCHLLGALDIYGSEDVTVSQNLSLMANSIYGTIYHLDPWHKMQLGWVEPRIRSLRDGGVAILPATQAIQPDAPVILYDPVRFNPASSTNEFFMLEYRTRSSASGSGYDRDVAGNGLAIWHIQQNAVKLPSNITLPEAGPYVGQAGWLFCDKCQGLFFSIPSPGPCPEDGGDHRRPKSPAANYFNYMMVSGVSEPIRQSGWRYCNKCQGLFYGPNQAGSFCQDHTGGLTHIAEGSDYSLVINGLSAPGQHGWKWCQKCQGLFFGPNQADSNCPKDSLQHDGSTSADYAMVRSLYHASVFTAGAPDLNQGGNLLWGSGVTSPYLKWLDGTATATRVFVRPFSPGDPTITVEWLAEADVWVDFAYPGFFEFGTFDYPFNTFAEGKTAVPHGGTLRIKAGASSETGTVFKRMRIEAYGGPVSIGR